MKKYFETSLKKFRNDSLSKVYYDIIKYLFLAIIVLIPFEKFVIGINNKLSTNISLSIWEICYIIFITSILSFYISALILNKSYSKVLKENQTDELTGLKNFKAIQKDFDTLYKEKEAVSLILFDIDNFKLFNEKFGYQVADKIMAKLGELLKNDSRIGDTVYRYFMKGDEFLIIARKTNISNAIKAAERKRELIENYTFLVDKQEFNLTISGGVTEFNSTENKEELFEKLQTALKKAKKNPNKNKIEIIG